MTARRATELVLAVAMAVSLGLIVTATNGQGFAIDELYYYARVAIKDGGLFHYDSPFSPEYLLSPFNGHLALGGRFTYESVFATGGAHYTVFVVVDALGICACAGLLFVFARRRIGDVAALAPALLVLFFGVAREQFLWPLDFNTSVALATGLAAILCLQRETRRGDVAACLLLAVSAAMIEVGLAFIVGAALLIAMTPERWRRAWIVVAPLILYAIWWIWSAKFGQGETELSNVTAAPKTFFESIAVSLGALTGTNPVHADSFGTEVTTLGRVLAAIGLVALVVRIALGDLPRTIWVWIVTALAYWTLLAIADRPPQSTRYLLVSAVLVLLVAADCFRRPLSNRVGAVLVVLALLPLPANVDALFTAEDENVLRTDVPKSRAEFAMLELAGERVDPGYVVSADPRVADLGGSLYLGIPAGAYLDASKENGSIAYSLDELREQPEEIREIADAALAGAYPIELEPGDAPGPAETCRTTKPRNGHPAVVEMAGGFNHVRVAGRGAPLIGLRRFASSGPGVPIAKLQAGGWAVLRLPQDGAEHWKLVTNATVTTCS
ncbi:MAG TPA: hypothetical protein VNC16_00425 [Solirubrobacterales bacterium]|jgi:hypothetical protein|nr:hypothetical protein [Solirubrobacterales bacterium]